MSPTSLLDVGAIFSILVFWHFFADWLFQSNKEALAKAKNWKVRARHCSVYTLLFWPLFLLAGFHGCRAGLATFILFMSHFIIDSYVPVMLWAKYLRRAPQFEYVGKTPKPQAWSDYGIDAPCYPDDVAAFKAFAATPIGLVLMITMDQFFHIAFLLPVAWLMVQ